MNTWIENLDNPLVLVGFVVFILAGVISLIIKIAKSSQNQEITGKGNTGIQAGGNVNMNTDDKAKKRR